MGSSNDRLSDAQLSALADAVRERLHLYRRGYARSKLGPFHARRTIEALQRDGFVVVRGVAPKAKATAAGRKQLASQLPSTGISSDRSGLPNLPRSSDQAAERDT